MLQLPPSVQRNTVNKEHRSATAAEDVEKRAQRISPHTHARTHARTHDG